MKWLLLLIVLLFCGCHVPGQPNSEKGAFLRRCRTQTKERKEVIKYLTMIKEHTRKVEEYLEKEQNLK